MNLETWIPFLLSVHSKHTIHLANDFFFFFFFFFCLFSAVPTAYRNSQARDGIRTAATGLHHSHSNARSLTHWAQPGIEPTSSWTLVGIVTAEPQWELQICYRVYILSLHLRRRGWGSRGTPRVEGRAPTTKKTRDRMDGFWAWRTRKLIQDFEDDVNFGEEDRHIEIKPWLRSEQRNWSPDMD